MKLLYFLLLITSASHCFGQQQVSLTDIQFSTTGASTYQGQVVQTVGVVTASAEPDNLGYVFMQEEGISEWGAIQLRGSLELASLRMGDKLTVQGTVYEDFGLTVLNDITSIEVIDSNIVIAPIELNPEYFSSTDPLTIEKYEGLYVRLVNGTDSVRVVNPDLGFGDYRIGLDTLTPSQGCNVLAGRQSSSANSSLNVSYVSDMIYANLDGMMNVPAIEVKTGDAFPWVQGIISFGSGQFRLLPRNNADFGSTTTGIRKPDSHKLTVYPNPSNGLVYIDMSPITGESVLEVYAINGQRILQKCMNNTDRSIDLSGLDQGIYQLRLRVGDEVYHQLILRNP